MDRRTTGGSGRAFARAGALAGLLLILGACDGGAAGDGAGDGTGGAPADAVAADDSGAPADAAPGADVPGAGGADAGPADDAGAGGPGPDAGAAGPPDGGAPTGGPAWLSQPHRTHVIDLGEQAFDQYGYTGDLTVSVPPGTEALFVLVDGEDGVSYVASSLQEPGGRWIVPRRWDLAGDPTLCIACENRVAAAEGTGTAMVPAAPPLAVVSGEYLFSVRGFRMTVTSPWGGATFSPAQVPARVRVLLREPLPPGEARLDLTLHFTGAGGVTAATAPTDEDVQGILATIDAIYAGVGIRVGTVRYADVPAELAVVETIRGEDADLSRLFRYSEGHPAALDLFFVESIAAAELGGFGVILGIAGGIPGPPLQSGSPRAGVAVVIDPPAMAAGVSTGNIAAHESGHFLGLYHTTEQSLFGMPAIYDAIEDTPQNDPRNLMYFTSTGQDTALTEGQGYVMRRHPLVYSASWRPAGAAAAAAAAAPPAAGETPAAAAASDPFVALIGATCGAPSRDALLAAAADAPERLHALALAEGQSDWVRQRAVSLLSHFPDATTEARLAALAAVGPPAQRALAVYTHARTFGAVDPEGALARLAPHLDAADPAVRDRAVRSLRWVAHPDAAAALERLERSAPEQSVRRLARHVLDRR